MIAALRLRVPDRVKSVAGRWSAFVAVRINPGEGRECNCSETFHCDPVGSTPSRQRRASQPEVRLAWVVATSLVKRRQPVLKPRGSPDMTNAEAFAVERAGAASTRPPWRGIIDSAGVQDRGKGTGRAAWEPERSHSRPSEKRAGKWDSRLTNNPARSDSRRE